MIVQHQRAVGSTRPCADSPPNSHQTHTFGFRAPGSGSYPDRGSARTDSRQNALPTYLSPGRAAKRKKMKIGGTYLLQGPFGPNKTNLPTYLGGASQSQQTPYPARSRNPVHKKLSKPAGGRGELVDAVVAVAAGPAHVSRAAARGGGRDCDRAQARRGVGGRRRRLDSPASLRASPSL